MDTVKSNKIDLSIYQKIGDIARQIETLDQKLLDDDIKPTQGVGGIELKTRRDIENMIKFHWVRIRYLEKLIPKTREEITQIKQDLRSQMCHDCQEKGDRGCSKDFFNYCFDSLLEDIL